MSRGKIALPNEKEKSKKLLFFCVLESKKSEKISSLQHTPKRQNR